MVVTQLLGVKITDVAPGRISATFTDAVNGSQLHAVASNLNNKINKVGKRADAGTASAERRRQFRKLIHQARA